MFHRRCGDRVNLINNNCTAERNFSTYDYGRVLSAEPLKDDEIFEVRIDKKIVSWSGSIEVGVTTCDPDTMELPAWATNLRADSWLLTGSGVVHDLDPITDASYGARCGNLEEGNTLGVMRTSNHELVFFINGESQGVAATNMPTRLFAVVDMYGNCVQVTITRPRRALATNEPKEDVEINNDFPMGEASNSSTTNVIANLNVNLNVNMNLPKNPSIAAIREDRLRFHERVGSLVKLSNNARTAERRRPLDEFNNGVVMTHRQLRDNELFEIRIDRLVDKWSGSIEVGVTTHSPTALEFPATMTNMRSGTTMMSGCGILTNGKGIQREYGEINLDELREGDRVGMIRRSNGNLHYLINGLDQGVAAKVPTGVWGVVELYGMTVKVTIVDRDEREEQNLVTRRNTLHLQGLDEVGDDEPLDRLTFHPCCGTHADVINNGRTAHRPNAMDDFNNGVVLTMRPLRPNELFEVRLDKIVTKWAGSIEIGVTTHSPTELEFPFTMTNVRSGTWIMTGNGVMHNGTTIIEQYGQNLDRLQVGDRVGVMRKDNATLHFYVNGADQGAAAVSVPERVYGVIDLYGQATQASIVDNTDFYSPTTNNSSFSNTTLYSDLRFHHVHGKHARITNNGLTASRIRALGEFNEAIVIANRALRDGELFEVSIDKMVGRWSGAIEAGVTAIRPDELEFPSTMTDIDHDTWMLSGSTVMRDGVTLRNHYACDLDKLTEGNRIGMMRCADSSLHYYLDGVDQGAACTGLPPHVYPVIDLYAQCAQVTIVLPERRDTMTQQYLPSENSTSQQPTSVLQPQPQTEIVHKFHQSVGLYLLMNSDRFIAARCKKFNSAILLSEIPLESNELIEITIEEVAPEWSGSLKVGVLGNEGGSWFTSMGLVPGMTTVPSEAWYLTGNEVRHKGDVLCSNYCPSLDWLREDDKIGLKRTHEGNLKFYINGEDMGVAASNVPEMVHAVVELFGSTIAVCITSSKQQSSVISPNASLRLQDSLELLLDPMPPTIRNDTGVDTSIDGSEAKLLNEMVLTPTQPITTSTGEIDWGYEFHENHGRNVELERKTTARRVASYNQGVLMSSRPLIKGKVFQVKIDKVTDRWVSGVLCGVTCISPEKASFPLTALGFKKHSWIICSDWMSHNGTKIKTRYGANLENLQAGCTVGLLTDEESRLHLFINGVDQGVAATDLPPYVYAVIDLYGQCEQISIVGPTVDATFMSNDAINMAIACTHEREEAEAEDVENSREKADLECHEKENAMPTIPSTLPLSLPSRSVSSGSNEDANCASAAETPTSPQPSHSNNYATQLINTARQSKATMSSSAHSDSNNSDTGSEMSNEPGRSGALAACGKLRNLAGSGSLNGANDSNTLPNNELENDESHRNECTNVELNNATNINIRNGSAATSSNMTNLNTAINSTNANNAINESIASNSQINNMTASNSNPNNLSTNMLNISQDNSSHHNVAGANNAGNNMTASAPNNMTPSMPIGVTLGVPNNAAAGVSNNVTASMPNNVATSLANNIATSLANNIATSLANNIATSLANNVVASLVNNVTASLANNVTVSQLNNVTASQPNNVTSSQPNNVTSSQSNNITTSQLNNVTAHQPSNVTANQPNNVTANQPNNVTTNQPNNVTTNQPNNVTANQPNNVTANQPNNASANQPNNITSSVPNNITASQPNNITSSVPNNVTSSSPDSQPSSNRQCDVMSNNCVSGVAATNLNIPNPSPQHNASLVGSLRVSSLPSTPLGTGGTPFKKCEYLKACSRLKKSLVLPDEFFSLDEVLCYCASCYKVEGDAATCRKGEPPAEFAIPVGWARFPLKQSINANQIPQSTTDKWHVAFYGTRLDSIRWILDRGELLTKEQLDTSNLTTIINIEDQNPQVVFSPNIKYAASEESTRKYPYIDTQSNRKLNASTAFQLLVRPGSYTMGPAKDATDSQLESTEWATKEAGATVIVALLIHLDDF